MKININILKKGQKDLCLSSGLKSGGRKQDLNRSTLWNLPLPPVSKAIVVLSCCLDTKSSHFFMEFL